MSRLVSAFLLIVASCAIVKTATPAESQSQVEEITRQILPQQFMDIHCQIASDIQVLAQTDPDASAALLKGATGRRLPITKADFNALTTSLCPALAQLRQLDSDQALAVHARWPKPPAELELRGIMSVHNEARQGIIDTAFEALAKSLTPEGVAVVHQHIFVTMAQRFEVIRTVILPPERTKGGQ